VGIIKSYTRATISSNLKDDEFHHDHEKLAAVALSGGSTGSPANLLFRVKYANDASSYSALLAELEQIVSAKAALRGWPKHINPLKVARLALEYWVNDICPVCSGKGHLPVDGVPNVLRDEPCHACKGTGTKALMCEENWRKYITEMVEALNGMAVHAGGEAIKKLANDMDF
jgi:hypothetical protein